jgi:Calpain family cysteine protease
MLFGVSKALEIYDPLTGVKERLLKLRDLSEKLDWTGDWGATSTKWGPGRDLKDHLGYAETYSQGSNSFYMSFDDYLSYFNSSCIVKLHHPLPLSKQHSPYVRETLRLSHGGNSYALAKF